MFVPKLTAHAASTACSCWTEYCSRTSGYVKVRDCCKGCDSTGTTGTTGGYCRTTSTRC